MEDHKAKPGLNKLLLLALGALGVVYGDIGTSPLYAINEIFFGPSHTAITKPEVFGAISLVFWALTIIICIKYVILVLRADSEGEGGVFALYSLIIKKIDKKKLLWIAGLLIFSSGLIFGDGMITPAISVISAVEGLKVLAPSLEPFIVPITISILTVLFLFQQKGTHKVGKVFGPVVLIWFFTLGALGLVNLIKQPQILNAINPYYGIKFLLTHKFMQNLLVLGSVMLVVTGGEALYADMGHFGAKPIRMGWFGVVYPALLLNYFGQGAYLLSGQEIIRENIFYSLVPPQLLFPIVILATCATVIASQALISGAFSIASQAVHLGILPRLDIRHTHEEHEGQIYIPFINWLLFAGCIFFVVVFKSSANLANAYGLAVNGDMVTTLISMLAISLYLWGWKLWKVLIIFVPILIIDLVFLASNSLKIPKGGYIPLLIGLGFFFIMKTWQWGRRQVRQEFKKYTSMKLKDLIKIKEKNESFLPRSIIVMTPYVLNSVEDTIPPIKQIFWERYGVVPQNLLLLTVRTLKKPYVHGPRYEVHHFYNDPIKGKITSLVINYGFMEDPEVEKTLHHLDTKNIIDIEDDPQNWLIHTAKAKLIYPNHASLFTLLRLNVLDLMFRLFNLSDYYFGLGNRVKLSVEIIPVQIK